VPVLAIRYYAIVNPSNQPLWLFILSFSVTGSIIAAVASGLNDHFRRRFELQKWRAEFYLRPKLDAIRNLHTTMVRSHYEINRRAKASMPENLKEYGEQVQRYEVEFFEALTQAEIYLDAETSKALHDVLGSVRQMSSSIWLRLPEVFETGVKYQDPKLREPEWQAFHDSFDRAHKKLKILLHPDEVLKSVKT
jgi:hypothetical protein